MKRKLISLLLAALMVLSLYPSLNLRAGAEETTAYDIVHTMDSGKIYFDSQTGTIVDAELSGEVEIPAQIQGHAVLEIGAWALSDKDNRNPFTSIILPDGLKKIGTGAFYRNQKLESVSFPDTLEEIADSAFSSCSQLTSAPLPKNLKVIGNSAFNYCDRLTGIDLPDSLEKLGSSAFGDSKEITIHENGEYLDGWYVGTKQSYPFTRVVRIKEGTVGVATDALRLPYPYESDSHWDLTTLYIPKSLLYIYRDAFRDINDMDCIIVDPDNPAYSSQDNILYNKDKTELIFCGRYVWLANVTLPQSLKRIGDRAFTCCKYLTSISLPEGVESIGEDAFNSSTLQEIHIGSALQFIGSNAFKSCSKLERVYFAGDAPEIGEEVFHYCPKLILYCGESAEGWTYPTWNEYPTVMLKDSELAASAFTDVPADAYYAEAVGWAVANSITNGTGNRKFEPESDCLRSQVVTFLWRAAGCQEPKVQENPFADVYDFNYFYQPVLWAVDAKITTGTSEGYFSPHLFCTRAQVVTFLWRLEGEPKAESAENPFVDVAADAYYYEAVLWALEEGITTGTSATEFSPDEHCTRAQIVTFLYRAFQ